MQDALYQVAPDMGIPRASYRWLSVGETTAAAIEKTMKAWMDTPYHGGQRARKIAVDCEQLIPGLLDMLFKRPTPTPLARQSPDAGTHSLRASFRSIVSLRRNFPCKLIRDGSVEPGDIVLVNVSSAGPQMGRTRLRHAMMVGVKPMTAIHAAFQHKVCMTSLATSQIVRTYRPQNKESWAV